MAKSKFEILDGIRGLASLYVVFHHARLVCWESYKTGYLNHPKIYNNFDICCLYFFSLFKYGGEAVTVFFVLSGFVIHYNQADNIESGKYEFDPLKYLIKRIRRIYPPLIFSILLMLAISLLQYFLENQEFPPELSIREILGNLTFIGIPYFKIVGNNFPLWSLRVEWWIYIIYPIALLLNMKNIAITNILVIVIAILIYFLCPEKTYFWTESLLFLPTWFIGVFLADVVAGRIKYYSIINMLCLTLPIVIFFDNSLNIYIKNFLFGVGLIPVFIALLNGKKSYIKKAAAMVIKPFIFFGKFSYTMYIIHFPVQLALAQIYMKYNNNLLPHNFYLAFLSIIISIIISYYSHFITEVKFVSAKKETIIVMQ